MTRSPFPKRLLKLSRHASIPIFLLTLAMAFRFASIGTNDLFHFGRGDRWWCYAIFHLSHVNISLTTYQPGHAPGFAWGKGPFFQHVVAGGGTWAISADKGFDSYVSHDWGILGWSDYSLAGHPTESGYWLNLPYVPLAAFFLSTAILSHWIYSRHQSNKTRQTTLCPTCHYDLRAHSPGQSCPECGTPIPLLPHRNS